MAIAKYFSKDALAISQLLQNGSVDLIEGILNKHIVEIAFDDNACTGEGLASLDLTMKLVCRLYPVIKLTDLSSNNPRISENLKLQSAKINSRITITNDDATLTLVVGDTKITRENGIPIFYIGSDNWLMKFSRTAPVASGNSDLPFAAGAAACLGAANLFKYVFRELIEGDNLDDEISFSLLDLTFKQVETTKITLNELGHCSLVGLGAIGNGVLWSFSKINHLPGKLTAIDHQQISLSNLQRYVLTEESDESKNKSEIAQRIASEKLVISPQHESWQTFIRKTGNSDHSVMLTALDSAKDRIAVQSSLPKHIFNGFTEQGLLGVSRHMNFLENPCLCCVYMPNIKKQSLSEEVAENLAIPQYEKQYIRPYLYGNLSVDLRLLELIAEANQINIDHLRKYIGTPISEFYANFVCGGIILTLKQNNTNPVKLEAPLAFQSALAGILLTSEFYLWKAGYRNESFPIMTHIYPLVSFDNGVNPYNHGLSKDKTGRCLCADEDYRLEYSKKWGVKIK